MSAVTNKLEGRDFFLDTSILVKSGYHVERPEFVALADLVGSGRARALTTSITQHEIGEHLRQDLNEAYETRKVFQHDAAILSNLDVWAPLFAKGQLAKDMDALRKKIDEYFGRLKPTEVTLKTVETEAVVQAYLRKAPPFGAGGKRHEFKDAIVLQALEAWSDDDERLYVISDDKDMASFCTASPTLVYLPTIGAFTDLVLRHDAALARQALDALQRHTSTIINQSTVLFEDMSFYVADYHDEEVIITDVTVAEPDEPELLEVDDDEARFQVFTTVSFVASVSADDPNTGYYDREDGAIYGMDRIERSVHGNVEVTITGQLTNFADKPDDAVVTCDGIYNESGRDNVIVLHLDDEDER